MKDDLISRQAAIALAKDICIPTKDGTIYRHRCIDPGDIAELPSAEPERKKGKWIDGMSYHDFDESEWEKVKCSVCENLVTKQIFYHDNKYHYCPYCGADMRGTDE